MTTKIMQFRETIPTGTSIISSDKSPLDGIIKNVIIHFPLGASALVDVAVYVKGTQIIPKEGFLALDDATVPFAVNLLVDLGNDIHIILRNRDSVFTHTISVMFEIEGTIKMEAM